MKSRAGRRSVTRLVARVLSFLGAWGDLRTAPRGAVVGYGFP